MEQLPRHGRAVRRTALADYQRTPCCFFGATGPGQSALWSVRGGGEESISPMGTVAEPDIPRFGSVRDELAAEAYSSRGPVPGNTNDPAPAPPQPLAQSAWEHERDEAIFRAYASGGYCLQEIGDHFGLHYSRVSRIVKQQRLAKDKT